ncbi:hypothetical protein MSAN_01063500 [Mycena sanguinolenta]|uniref:Uncharacterized protein n=1 Tax=Mycena sanguinolenta TaxID=230812 RepID=A0A8H7D9P9_9AGAR|nr:hypothetical protein MSAN_01063500 [Mycena sanguinolenta]
MRSYAVKSCSACSLLDAIGYFFGKRAAQPRLRGLRCARGTSEEYEPWKRRQCAKRGTLPVSQSATTGRVIGSRTSFISTSIEASTIAPLSRSTPAPSLVGYGCSAGSSQTWWIWRTAERAPIIPFYTLVPMPTTSFPSRPEWWDDTRASAQRVSLPPILVIAPSAVLYFVAPHALTSHSECDPLDKVRSFLVTVVSTEDG